jgi:hypothetical protein
MKDLKQTPLHKEKIESKYGKIIYSFPVFHHNWELDGYGFVVEDTTGRKIILTNHNQAYEASKNEIMSKIAEYTKLISDTKKALYLYEAKQH